MCLSEFRSTLHKINSVWGSAKGSDGQSGTHCPLSPRKYAVLLLPDSIYPEQTESVIVMTATTSGKLFEETLWVVLEDPDIGPQEVD